MKQPKVKTLLQKHIEQIEELFERSIKQLQDKKLRAIEDAKHEYAMRGMDKVIV